MGVAPSFNISPVSVSHRNSDDGVRCEVCVPRPLLLVVLLVVVLLLLLLVVVVLLLLVVDLLLVLALVLVPVKFSNNIATDSLNHTNTTMGSLHRDNSSRINAAVPSTYKNCTHQNQG